MVEAIFRIPVSKMTNKELRTEAEHIIAMMQKGPIGNTAWSCGRISAVMRETVRRMKPDAPTPEPTDV